MLWNPEGLPWRSLEEYRKAGLLVWFYNKPGLSSITGTGHAGIE